MLDSLVHATLEVREGSVAVKRKKSRNKQEHLVILKHLDMVIVIDYEEIEAVPDDLDEFFDIYPTIGKANKAFTDIEHVNMWRDNVLFIKQRQQATSDFRENPKVKWLGSHAAMTCHIVVMQHTLSGVVSLGHFDNFCCWQLGEESSAHRDGLDIMVDEISTLSNGDYEYIEVTVVGGYTDVRGDAAKNSLSLLNALHEHWAYLNLKRFCVGRYNTQKSEATGANEAILKGIAFDLEKHYLFPAIYNWGQYEDFKNQLQDKVRRTFLLEPDQTLAASNAASEAMTRITDGSTFKPKSLRNQSRTLQAVAETSKTENSTNIKSLKRTHVINNKIEEDSTASNNNPFKVKLRPLKPLLSHWAPSSSPRKARKKKATIEQ